eukprot:5354703-Amphidinium_carterae.1
MLEFFMCLFGPLLCSAIETQENPSREISLWLKTNFVSIGAVVIVCTVTFLTTFQRIRANCMLIQVGDSCCCTGNETEAGTNKVRSQRVNHLAALEAIEMIQVVARSYPSISASLTRVASWLSVAKLEKHAAAAS